MPSISRGFRVVPPSSYALDLDSYSKLISSGAEPYESDVFQSGGYNWTLKLYPSGKISDNGADHISLYLKLNNTDSLPNGWAINAKISFFVQNRTRYLAVEDSEVQRFDATTTTEYGIGKLIQLSTFTDEKNGYLVSDKCQFGVEINLVKPYQNSERLTFVENPKVVENPNESYVQYTTTHFSQSDGSQFLYSGDFTVEGSTWKVRVAPKGDGDGFQKFLSIYLELANAQSLRETQKVYVKASVEVLSKVSTKNIKRQLGQWYSRDVPSLGFQKFMSLADLNDTSKEYLQRDRLTIQVTFQVISKTQYIP